MDARLDQYETCPREGWPRWAINEISVADFVLVVCTPGYSKRFHRSEASDDGKGVAWEASIILQEIYEAGGVNRKFLPVVFSSKHRSIVPVELRSSTIYELGRKDGYLELYRRITKQPEVEKPTLGKLPATPARQ